MPLNFTRKSTVFHISVQMIVNLSDWTSYFALDGVSNCASSQQEMMVLLEAMKTGSTSHTLSQTDPDKVNVCTCVIRAQVHCFFLFVFLTCFISLTALGINLIETNFSILLRTLCCEYLRNSTDRFVQLTFEPANQRGALSKAGKLFIVLYLIKIF